MKFKTPIILCALVFSGCFTDTTTAGRTNNNSTGETNNSTGKTNNKTTTNNKTATNNNGLTSVTSSSTGGAIACTADAECAGLTCLKDAEDPTKNVCGECLTSDACPSLSASKCGDDNLCGACGVDADCAQFEETPGCDDGICRECTKDAHCDGTACDLSTNTCSDQVLGDVDQCEACVSDSACRLGSHCIVLSYKGQRNGQFCLLEKKNAPNGMCPEPKYSQAISRVSVSGYPASEHCGIKESVTTCKAVASPRTFECELQDLSYLCIADSEGGACYVAPLNPNTGIAQPSCGYACDNDNQCDGECRDGACRLQI